MHKITILLMIGSLLSPLFSPIAEAVRIRKDQSNLSATEQTAFVNALHSMKTTASDNPNVSVYEQFVTRHASTVAYNPNPAHQGPAFLPWHRQFIWEFESAMLDHDQTGTLTGLTYWNWALDQDTSKGPWTDNFLGGNGDPEDHNIVKSGPFREGEWAMTVNIGPDENNEPIIIQLDNPEPLMRAFGIDESTSTLPSVADVVQALAINVYDTAPWNYDSDINGSFRNNLEGFHGDDIGLHNRVHVWAGGSMGPMTSPIDPVFWLHHAFVDNIWFEWQSENGYDTYLPLGDGPDGHNLNDLMPGLDVLVADALDPRDFGGEGYIYQGAVIPDPTFFGFFTAAMAALIVLRRRRTS